MVFLLSKCIIAGIFASEIAEASVTDQHEFVVPEYYPESPFAFHARRRAEMFDLMEPQEVAAPLASLKDLRAKLSKNVSKWTALVKNEKRGVKLTLKETKLMADLQREREDLKRQIAELSPIQLSPQQRSPLRNGGAAWYN